MRYKNSTLGGLARLLMLSLFIQACASVPLTEKLQAMCPKCKDPHRYVRMSAGGQQRVQGKIAHPFLLSPQDWAQVLNGIRARDTSESYSLFSGKGEVSQVFTPDDVDYLSVTLSKMFAQVQPTQLVAFGLSRAISSDLIEVTTGGWYVEGTRIHLLLANNRHAVSMPKVLGRLWGNPLVAGVSQVFEIVPGAHQKLRASGKSDIPDLSIDYQALLAKPVRKP